VVVADTIAVVVEVEVEVAIIRPSQRGPVERHRHQSTVDDCRQGRPVHGSRDVIVPLDRLPVPGTRHAPSGKLRPLDDPAPGTRHPAPGTRHPAPGRRIPPVGRLARSAPRE